MAEPLDGLTPEQRRLVEENLDLVHMQFLLVGHKLLRWEKEEDLMQAGFMGLIKAAMAFDPNAGWKFRTFAKHWVAGGMHKAAGREIRENRRVHAAMRAAGHEYRATQVRQGDALTDMDGKAEERLHGYCDGMVGGMFAAAVGKLKPGTPERIAAEHELFRKARAVFDRFLQRLTDRDAKLMRMRFEEDISMVDIATELRISVAGAYRQRDRILTRLRAILEAEGVTVLPLREDEQ